MSSRFLMFLLRRALKAVILVALVSSVALLLARVAPGDHFSAFEVPREILEAERKRLCHDCPLIQQYALWVSGIARFDLGESTVYPGRAVSALIAERAGNSALIGCASLTLATLIGIPLGVLTGSRRSGALVTVAKGSSILLLSIPPVVLSLSLLLLASRSGWFPVGGLPPDRTIMETLRYVALPALALALPIAAALERLQSRALADAMRDPSIVAARARGLSRTRLVWRHAFRLSLKPVLAIYGIIVGTVISGSFVVEYVMTWPGLGRLMYDALVYRDANLVAGCAATGAAFLALGILISDIALAAVDPRLEEAL